MNKMIMIYEDEDSKTTVERTTDEDMDIYFAGRCFYEFLKGNGFCEEVIANILITDGLYDI